MVKRFIERFQLWLRERADEREDKFVAWLLFVAALIILLDGHALLTAHHLPWRAALGSVFTLAFIVLYIRQARSTWVLLLAVSVTFLVQVPFAFFTAPAHISAPARLLAAAIVFALAVAAFVYSLVIRRRFADGTRTI